MEQQEIKEQKLDEKLDHVQEEQQQFQAIVDTINVTVD